MTEAELDELLTLHWPRVMRRAMSGELDEWERGFARSIARHAKRPSWMPTRKQAAVMRRLVSELDRKAEVIER